MTKTRFSRSVAKYIRTEKARIRRTVSDSAEQEKQIQELLTRLSGNAKK